MSRLDAAPKAGPKDENPMSKVLVTGGAGYIGSHTLRLLKASGFEPICFDNLSTGYPEFVTGMAFHNSDLNNPDDLDAVFSNHEISAVIHFAAHSLVEESCINPHKYYHNNIMNALNLVEAMRRHRVSMIVFSSSCATYGIPDRIPLEETMSLNPVNPYGMTKMVIERILSDYKNAHGIRYVSLRYFNAAGAAADGSLGEWHVPETHLIPRLLEIAMGNQNAAEIYGDDYPTPDGTCIRDYVHVDDLGLAHIAALNYLSGGHPSDVFNLGTGSGYSVLQVVDEVRRVAARQFPVTIRPRRPGDPPQLVANPRKAQALLGWGALHSSLEEIVASAWNWRRGAICRALSERYPATF